jgi:ubiquitin C-terminal hydrolase
MWQLGRYAMHLYAKQSGPPTYDLYGVINHEGNLARGHYYTYAKHRDDLNWYCYNDSLVT